VLRKHRSRRAGQRKRWATSWRDARDEIGGDRGFEFLAVCSLRQMASMYLQIAGNDLTLT